MRLEEAGLQAGREGAGGLHPRRARALRVFLANRMAVAGAVGVGVVTLAALLAPVLAPFDPTLQGELATGRLQPPGSGHLLGTDQFARDVLSRLLHGARVSLGIGVLAVALGVGAGTVTGALAGWKGGWLDALLMRTVDLVLSFPRLVLLILLVALLRPSIGLVIVLLGFIQWPVVARIVRAEVRGQREREFVEAGRALGFSESRLLLRHVLPNAMGPILVVAALGVGEAIILEAGLSFLGLGVQPPTPSWGGMVAEGRHHLLGGWWLATVPGLAIVLVVLSFNLVGDGVRDALDPRLGS